MRVGILAIQGAFQKHQDVLDRLEVSHQLVRQPADLTVDALIVPGGESTTITRVLQAEGWLENIRQYASSHPVFGTCAGAILLGAQVDSEKVIPWNVIDMTLSRNAYGRQINSFTDQVLMQNHRKAHHIPAVFIRAPRILKTGPDVDILGTLQGEPVLVQYGLALASTFHPELTDSTEVHRYFIENICRSAYSPAIRYTESVRQGDDSERDDPAGN